MATDSNTVTIVGNLTRDPEMRYTAERRGEGDASASP